MLPDATTIRGGLARGEACKSSQRAIGDMHENLHQHLWHLHYLLKNISGPFSLVFKSMTQ
jgi:hypothetical protein